MKNQMLFLLFIIFLISCSEEEQTNIDIGLIGNWKLIEILADPGDGSGTFQPVQSDRIIEFKRNGTLTTNGSLCEPYSDEMISSGSFGNNTIITNCQDPNISKIYYELESQYLILNFISNEGYSQKFQKE